MSKHAYHGDFNAPIWRDYIAVVGYGNVRKDLENYMIQRVQCVKGLTEDIDLALLQSDINKLEETNNKVTSQLQAKQLLKDKILKRGEEERIKSLEDEKEEREKAMMCLVCGNQINEGKKHHNFKKGSVCHACFMGIKMEDVKKWS